MFKSFGIYVVFLGVVFLLGMVLPHLVSAQDDLMVIGGLGMLALIVFTGITVVQNWFFQNKR